MRPWLLLIGLTTSALAAEPTDVAEGDAPADAAPDAATAPVILERTHVGLPSHLAEGLTFPVTCQVSARVVSSGYADVDVTGCPDELVERLLQQAFAKWRWEVPSAGSENVHRYDAVWADKNRAFEATWTGSGHAEGGEDDSEAGGVVGGQLGGVEGGVLGGQLGETGGAVVKHHSEIRVKRRVNPTYPEAAKAMGLAKATCRTRVFIDEKGVPYDVQFDACPKVFHESTRSALFMWRWYPARDRGGSKVKVTTVLNIVYKLE